MFEPKIVGFLCSWCSYTGADLAGTARLKSPWNFRAIRVPCSGRVSPELVMKAFDEGADGVLVLGCHIGECHYDTGNHRAAKRIPILLALMTFAGLEPDRLKLDWVSASEGERFVQIVTEFTEGVRALGPVKWRVEDGQWGLGSEQFSVNSKQWSAARILSEAEKILNTNQHSLITEKIQNKAQEILTSGEVSCVIGYEVGPRGRTRPTFVYQPEDVTRLVWDQNCTHNLTTYLSEKLKSKNNGDPPPKVAVVVKPCDSKSLNVMLAERRLWRDLVHVIGVTCDGIQVGAGFGKSNGHLQNRCLECTDRQPVVSDTLIGETIPSPHPTPDTQTPKLQYRLEHQYPWERLEFWLSQFDRCIRCYACRQACPNCVCPTCLYEQEDSLWVGMNIELNEKRTFHLGRVYHQAGRCVGCDECERVCPMNVPIGLLNRKIAAEIEAQFGHRAGLEAIPAPITTILAGEEG